MTLYSHTSYTKMCISETASTLPSLQPILTYLSPKFYFKGLFSRKPTLIYLGPGFPLLLNPDHWASQSLWPLLWEQQEGQERGLEELRKPRAAWAAWAPAQKYRSTSGASRELQWAPSPLKALPQDCLCSHPKQQPLLVSIPNIS